MYRFLGFVALVVSILIYFGSIEIPKDDKTLTQLLILAFGMLLFNKADIVDLEKEVATLKGEDEERPTPPTRGAF